VSPISGVEAIQKRKILHLLESKPGLPASSLTLHPDYDFLDNISVSNSGVPRFSLLSEIGYTVFKFYLDFRQSLQANSGIASHIRPHSFHSTIRSN
jgi:hypothetical protein